MDYGKLRDAIWPIVAMRIGAYFLYLLMILAAVLLGLPASSVWPLVLFALALYLLIYAYGGFRAVSKFGFSTLQGALIGALIGCAAAALSAWDGDWAKYAISIAVEGASAFIAAFLGAMVAKAMKK